MLNAPGFKDLSTTGGLAGLAVVLQSEGCVDATGTVGDTSREGFSKSAPPSHSFLVFVDFVDFKFFISAGVSALAGSSWGQQLLLMIGADPLEPSSIWPRTEPLHKQAIFRQTLPRDIESVGKIIFVWAFSYCTFNCHPNEVQRQSSTYLLPPKHQKKEVEVQ